MRGARSTLVMLVVFLGLGAYVYFVEMERPPASETPPNKQLFALEADDIETIAVRAGESETHLRRDTADAWQVTGLIEAQADDTTVSAIASEIATLEIRRVVEEAVVDLEPFGLSAPSADVSFTVAGEETERRLLVGDTSPTGADRYAKLADEDRIILVAASVESTFNKSTFDLRDKTALDFQTAEVDRLEIEVGGSRLEFSKADNEWRLVEPLDVRADFSTVEGMVGRLSGSQMLSVSTEDIDTAETADDADADPYGLVEPAVTATVRTGSATATLLVGSTTPTGERYARDASRPIVFTIDGTLGSDLEREAHEYRRKDLFAFRSFNATRLEIERPESTAAFQKTESTDEDPDETWSRILPEVGEVARSDIDDLLAKVSNLRADSFIESRADAGLSDSNILATIRVVFGDEDTEETVVFWRTGEETYGVNGDEPGAGVVNTRSVDEALETALATES